jgi:hypothetical protein
MRDDLKKLLFWGALTALVFWGAGWRSRELFGPAVVRDVHHEFAVPVGVDTTMYVYEFSGDCKVRRK